jgi:hypothetical protein
MKPYKKKATKLLVGFQLILCEGEETIFVDKAKQLLMQSFGGIALSKDYGGVGIQITCFQKTEETIEVKK